MWLCHETGTRTVLKPAFLTTSIISFVVLKPPFQYVSRSRSFLTVPVSSIESSVLPRFQPRRMSLVILSPSLSGICFCVTLISGIVYPPAAFTITAESVKRPESVLNKKPFTDKKPVAIAAAAAPAVMRLKIEFIEIFPPYKYNNHFISLKYKLSVMRTVNDPSGGFCIYASKDVKLVC